MTSSSRTVFPANPLEHMGHHEDFKRRMVRGILESYNSNYDVLGEMAQNACDALEDAQLLGLSAPFQLQVRVDLQQNILAVLDTGPGMNWTEAVSALAPNVSFKTDSEIKRRRGSRFSYRGYKGVGLTFLAYGTDEIVLHTKKAGGALIRERMQFGRKWAFGELETGALVVEDQVSSPLDGFERGTYVQVQLAPDTRPKRLSGITTDPQVWETILRTRTAVGQISLLEDPQFKMDVSLHVIDTNGKDHFYSVQPEFLYPHLIERNPPFRFLNLGEYYQSHRERSNIPTSFIRQDGVQFVWDADRIKSELTASQREKHSADIEKYQPELYAFLPYQGSVWGELNQICTGTSNRRHLRPGLVLAVNRQRLADVFDIAATRYETLSRNMLVLVHFANAQPDQGRKTVQDEIFELAQHAADRALQYAAKQQDFLKSRGDAPTPSQREVEKNHEDWKFNVQVHAQNSPLHLPPVTYVSQPLSEQDVVGLFNQLCALGVFPGIEIYATSQSQTYDSLVAFNCDVDQPGLRYSSYDENPLGLSPYTLGARRLFATSKLTLEFKNNLDGLIGDLDQEDSRKEFSHVQICVCWSLVDEDFDGYTIEEITTQNVDERKYPGATHLLRRDSDSHVIQVVMLETVIDMIRSGRLAIDPEVSRRPAAS